MCAHGAPPRAMTAPVNIADVQRACVGDLHEEWKAKATDTAYLRDSHQQSYVVLNLCRIVYTALCGEASSKRVAATWVMEQFPEWLELIQTADRWHYGVQLDKLEIVVEFIRFATPRYLKKAEFRGSGYCESYMCSRRPRLTLTCMALACAMAFRLPLTAQGQRAPFVVGVWGQDDAIIPFADFDGHRWRSSWPSAVDQDPEAIPLQRIPARWWGRSTFQTSWELLEPTGARRGVRIVATGPTGLGSGCSRTLGLRTDAPATYQYGEVLASSRSGVVEPIDQLTSNAAHWRTVSRQLSDIYRRYEPAAWQSMSEDFRPNLSAPLSAPRLDAAYRFMDDLGEYTYFESSREYQRRADQSGEEHSFITGWMWRASATSPFQLVTVRPATQDADGKGPESLRPLGVFRHGTRRYWFGSLSSYAYSGMTVMDVRRGGITQVLLVDYPGC